MEVLGDSGDSQAGQTGAQKAVKGRDPQGKGGEVVIILII